MNRPPQPEDVRAAMIREIVRSLRALLTESDRVAHGFAMQHRLSPSDFRALLHVVASETEGAPLAASDLRSRLNVSAGAITYIIDRLVKAGHVRRDADPSDRRKVILRFSQQGFDLCRSYFEPIQTGYTHALARVSEHDLAVAEAVLDALVVAMRSPTPDTELIETVE
ncbi:MAG: MarR family transcriptional regulator [Mycolicibacterium sp.]|nr:MarR family transcriptional regulator [Mycolicibacterium sp.]